MEITTLQFKTNIKCAACVAKISPYLDKAAGAGNWKVDLTHKDRVLTTTGGVPKDIETAAEQAGYKVELLNS